jgi:hypothetical protein
LSDDELYKNILDIYIKKNEKLNATFLIYLLHYNFTKFMNIFIYLYRKKFDKKKFINAFIDTGFKDHLKLLFLYKPLKNTLEIEKFFDRTFYSYYKKVIDDDDDYDIKLKLLKLGILLPDEAYNIFDENFMEEAKKIDSEILYVLTNEKFKQDLELLSSAVDKASTFKLLLDSKKSYIFTIKALRLSEKIFENILPKFKKIYKSMKEFLPIIKIFIDSDQVNIMEFKKEDYIFMFYDFK